MYDKLGNITKVTSNSTTSAQYTYDAQSQLVMEKLPQSNLEYTYSYDTGGNIRSIVTKNNGTQTTRTFSYTDSNWKDLLTAVDGHSLTYDAGGNPLTYYNGADWSFSWKNGRELATAVSGNTSVSYTYDSDGIRTSKTVNGVTHNYVYLGDLLVEETWGSNKLQFAYDDQNKPYSVKYNDNLYYYVLNQQGDVIRLVNGDGVIRAEYTYNAWGELVGITNGGAIATVNPLRYRGYVYDDDSGLYYLNSRYYDPVNCRFINTDDAISSIGGIILGYNVFCYCFNNPVNISDTTGHWPQWIQNIVNTVKHVVKSVVNKVKSTISKVTKSYRASTSRTRKPSLSKSAKNSDHDKNKRPYKGNPGSTYVAPNGDRRTYGPDGRPLHDYDHDDHGYPDKHPHDENGGHNHDWDGTVRGPAYVFKWESLTGIALVGACLVGTTIATANDITGVGVADDFLIAPFTAGIEQGLILIFK